MGNAYYYSQRAKQSQQVTEAKRRIEAGEDIEKIKKLYPSSIGGRISQAVASPKTYGSSSGSYQLKPGVQKYLDTLSGTKKEAATKKYMSKPSSYQFTSSSFKGGGGTVIIGPSSKGSSARGKAPGVYDVGGTKIADYPKPKTIDILSPTKDRQGYYPSQASTINVASLKTTPSKSFNMFSDSFVGKQLERSSSSTIDINSPFAVGPRKELGKRIDDIRSIPPSPSQLYEKMAEFKASDILKTKVGKGMAAMSSMSFGISLGGALGFLQTSGTKEKIEKRTEFDIKSEFAQEIDKTLAPYEATGLVSFSKADPVNAIKEDMFKGLTRFSPGMQETVKKGTRLGFFEEKIKSAKTPTEAYGLQLDMQREQSALLKESSLKVEGLEKKYSSFTPEELRSRRETARGSLGISKDVLRRDTIKEAVDVSLPYIVTAPLFGGKFTAETILSEGKNVIVDIPKGIKSSFEYDPELATASLVVMGGTIWAGGKAMKAGGKAIKPIGEGISTGIGNIAGKIKSKSIKLDVSTKAFDLGLGELQNIGGEKLVGQYKAVTIAEVTRKGGKTLYKAKVEPLLPKDYNIQLSKGRATAKGKLTISDQFGTKRTGGVSSITSISPEGKGFTSSRSIIDAGKKKAIVSQNVGKVDALGTGGFTIDLKNMFTKQIGKKKLSTNIFEHKVKGYESPSQIMERVGGDAGIKVGEVGGTSYFSTPLKTFTKKGSRLFTVEKSVGKVSPTRYALSEFRKGGLDIGVADWRSSWLPEPSLGTYWKGSKGVADTIVLHKAYATGKHGKAKVSNLFELDIFRKKASSTLAHELIHYKQFKKTPGWIYNIEGKLPYRFQPSEFMAYKLEGKYGLKGFDVNINTLIRQKPQKVTRTKVPSSRVELKEVFERTRGKVIRRKGIIQTESIEGGLKVRSVSVTIPDVGKVKVGKIVELPKERLGLGQTTRKMLSSKGGGLGGQFAMVNKPKVFQKSKSNVFQTLYHAGDIFPSSYLKKKGVVYGFRNLEGATKWKQEYGKKSIFQFTTDKFKIDDITYQRTVEQPKTYPKGEEVIAQGVLSEVKLKEIGGVKLSNTKSNIFRRKRVSEDMGFGDGLILEQKGDIQAGKISISSQLELGKTFKELERGRLAKGYGKSYGEILTKRIGKVKLPSYSFGISLPKTESRLRMKSGIDRKYASSLINMFEPTTTPASRRKTIIGPDQIIGFDSILTQKSALAQTQVSRFPGFPMPSSFTPPPPPPTGFPLLPFFFGTGKPSSSYRRTKSRTKFKSKYTPSFVATYFNIKGKRPGLISGLEIRPILGR